MIFEKCKKFYASIRKRKNRAGLSAYFCPAGKRPQTGHVPSLLGITCIPQSKAFTYFFNTTFISPTMI